MRKSGSYGTGRIFQASYKDRHGHLRYSKRYHIAYPRAGREVKEKTGSTLYAEALKLLKQRLSGVLPDAPKERFTVESLITLVENDYAQEKRKSLATLKRSRFSHLRQYFGDRDIQSLNRHGLRAYRERRHAEGAANGTINREVAVIVRGFRLAYERDQVKAVPTIKKLKEGVPRAGFFELEQFERVLDHVDPWWHSLYRVAYITGWRIDAEICPLRWTQVDFVNRVLRLEPGMTKNSEGRNFGFTPNLERALKEQRKRVRELELQKGRIIPWVFPRQRTANPLTSAYKPFKAAAIAAGLPLALQHDFRRTAVRNLEFAGVDRPTAKRMVGHKTDSIYERYAIVDKRKLDLGAERLSAYEKSVEETVKRLAAEQE